MDVKVSLILAMVLVAAAIAEGGGGVFMTDGLGHVATIGDFIGADAEMMMESEGSRRALAAGRRYIGYGALRANQVPCGRRGQSYYNCQNRQRANPYRRACTAITHCARYTG